MSSTDRTYTVPAGQLYAALLDTGSLPRRYRSDPRRLGYLFEEWLPIPIEEVHAVYRQINATTTLAVGVDRHLMNECDDRVAYPMAPEELPEHLKQAGIRADQLDLRTGTFMPRPVRMLRRYTMTAALIGLTAVVGVLSAGMISRAEIASDRADRIMEHRLKLLAAALPSAGQDPRPAAVRLITETRRLEAAASTAGPDQLAADVALSGVLASWPSNLTIRTRRLSVSQDTLRIIADLESPASAQELAESLSPPDGWRSDPPRVSNRRGTTQVTIVHRPEEIDE